MTQKELEQKVIDAEGRVAKREAVLKKHNSQLAKMIEKGADRFDINIKREDIKSATSKLAEARETLANWQDTGAQPPRRCSSRSSPPMRTRAMSPTRSAQPLNRLPRTAKPKPRPSWPSASLER